MVVKNTLIKLLNQFPNVNWDWYELSYNPNITFDFVKENLNKKWNWTRLSSNPSITQEDIQSNPDMAWEWQGIAENPNITLEFIKENIDRLTQADECNEWRGISSNPNITIEFIKENINKPWNWLELSRNPCITLDIIIKNPDIPWNWYGISCNSNITMDMIKENPDKPWIWFAISMNPNITWDFIRSNLDKQWDWLFISSNVNMDINFIRELPCISKFNWKLLSSNPYIISEEMDWNLHELIANPSITPEFIKEKLYERWTLNYVQQKENSGTTVNKNIQWKKIILNIKNPIQDETKENTRPFVELSSNPNITFKFIMENPDINWCWTTLSSNHFNYHPYFSSIQYKKKMTKLMNDRLLI